MLDCIGYHQRHRAFCRRVVGASVVVERTGRQAGCRGWSTDSNSEKLPLDALSGALRPWTSPGFSSPDCR